MRNGFDAGSIHCEGKWEGLGPGNQDFLALLNGIEPIDECHFWGSKSLDIQSLTLSHLPLNHRCIGGLCTNAQGQFQGPYHISSAVKLHYRTSVVK